MKCLFHILFFTSDRDLVTAGETDPGPETGVGTGHVIEGGETCALPRTTSSYSLRWKTKFSAIFICVN